MRLVFGMNVETETLKKVLGAFKQCGLVQYPTAVAKRSKSELAQYVSSHQEEMVVVLTRVLDPSSPYTPEELEGLKLSNEKVRYIYILSNKYKGSDYVQKLYNIGLFDTVFTENESRFGFGEIIALLKEGRTQALAKREYGLDVGRPAHIQSQIEARVNESVNDLDELVRYIEDGSFAEIDNRIAYVEEKTNRQEFIVIMRSLSENIRAELIRKGGYELYFANEAAAIKASEEPEKKVQTKVVNVTQYVNVNDAIGVVGLTRECGSTLVALNLARALADVGGLSPCLIQLPATNGDLFERLSFADYFGSNFVSHLSSVLEKGTMGSGNNEYCKVNFVVENPLVEDLSAWDESSTLRLLLSAPSPKIIDLGSCYKNALYANLVPTLKQLVVVVDDTVEELTTEDIRAFKDLAVAYPSLKLSFVVNKCASPDVSEAISFINDEYPYAVLPIFTNNNFTVAGCDMLYPNIKNGFSELVELVGYRLGNVTSTPTMPKAAPKKVVKQRAGNFASMEIAICGVGRSVGTTHTAIMLANSLKKTYKVCVIEQNDTGALANMYRKLHPETAAQQSLIQVFSYKGVDYFPVCNYGSFLVNYRDDYDIIVVDYGVNHLRNENFLRASKKVICASASEWKQYELTRFYGDTRKKIDPACKFIYTIPFMMNGALGNIRKICKGSKVLAVPVCMDAFSPSSEAEVVLNTVLEFGTPERKRGLFSRKR